jgi:DNA-binding response OmpR family regulator
MKATNAKKILVVDDDEALRSSLSEQLRLHEEFDTVEADAGAAALELAKAEYFDAILLDVGLPDMDGREVCRLMRRAGVKSPVIMLTAMDSDADTILALDAGANDYVTKPFRLGVLLARLRAQLRQHEQSEDAVFTIGPYSFRPAAKILLHMESNRKVRLTEKETAILKYLYRAGDKTVGRDTLLDPFGRGLGLQRRRHHPHARDPRLSPQTEDRGRPLECRNPDHGAGRLPSGALDGADPVIDPRGARSTDSRRIRSPLDHFLLGWRAVLP